MLSPLLNGGTNKKNEIMNCEEDEYQTIMNLIFQFNPEHRI